MRLLYIILVVSLYSCHNTKSKEQISLIQSTENKVDTFNLRNLYDDSLILNEGIKLDTVKITANKEHLGITLIYPKLSQEKLLVINQMVQNLVHSREYEFYKKIKNKPVKYDSRVSYPLGRDMWVNPILLYTTDKLVSFAFETGTSYSGMPSNFDYRIINYDIERKKKIELSDYFKLVTKSDSLYLGDIIKQAIGINVDANKYLEDIIFAFDDQSVYFLFEKYHIWTWGIFSVEKKYILDHINPEYR